jgi:GNAT superfamily N-acetyltransferase
MPRANRPFRHSSFELRQSFVIRHLSFPMSLTFQPASASDIPALRDLAARIWHGSYPGMITVKQIDYMLAWMYSAGKIAEELAAGVHWDLAVLDNIPSGYLSLTFHSATLAELNKLYLLPELQGRGLGQEMLAHTIATAARHGCAELRLRVNKRNARALRSYDRAGFRIVDAIVADIGGGYVMDDYILARPIA